MMEPICCPETSVRKYATTLRKSQCNAVFIYCVSETRNHVEECAHEQKEVEIVLRSAGAYRQALFRNSLGEPKGGHNQPQNGL
jgi:hypothetical protein